MCVLELVVLGTGSQVEQINPDISHFLKKKGISLEIQDTVSYICITDTLGPDYRGDYFRG